MKAAAATASLAAIALLGFAQPEGGKDIRLSKENGTLQWTGRKVTGEHTGNISIQKGWIRWDGKTISGGEVYIDMSTITCTDLDGEWRDKLVGHLKSDDFFGVDKHPVATFKIRSVEKKSGNAYEASGDMTIKGQTQPVSFPVVMDKHGDKLKVAGTAKIDRTKFDIRYGSKSFFGDIGDKAIEDTFDLRFDLDMPVKGN